MTFFLNFFFLFDTKIIDYKGNKVRPILTDNLLTTTNLVKPLKSKPSITLTLQYAK